MSTYQDLACDFASNLSTGLCSFSCAVPFLSHRSIIWKGSILIQLSRSNQELQVPATSQFVRRTGVWLMKTTSCQGLPQKQGIVDQESSFKSLFPGSPRHYQNAANRAKGRPCGRWSKTQHRKAVNKTNFFWGRGCFYAPYQPPCLTWPTKVKKCEKSCPEVQTGPQRTRPTACPISCHMDITWLSPSICPRPPENSPLMNAPWPRLS